MLSRNETLFTPSRAFSLEKGGMHLLEFYSSDFQARVVVPAAGKTQRLWLHRQKLNDWELCLLAARSSRVKLDWQHLTNH